MALAPLLNLLGREFGVNGLQLTRSSSAPLIHWGYKNPKHALKPEKFKEQWANLALNTATSRKLKIIFLVGYWQIYSRPSLPQELVKTIEEFNKRGVKVVLVTDNPSLPNDPWRQANLSIKWDLVEPPTIAPKIQQEHKEKNLLVSKATASLPPQAQVEVVDLSPTIFGWKSLLSEKKKILYYDDDHLSDEGALEMRPLFAPIFKEMAQGK